MKISFYLLIIVLAGLTILGWWSFLPKNLLVGSWGNKSETIEIYSGNTLSISSPKQPVLNGSYQLLNDDKARIDLGGIGALLGPVIVTYQVTVNTLTVSDGKKTSTYNRTSKLSPIVAFFNKEL